jgi:DNA polymerase-1
MRLLIHYSGDPELVDICNQGGDVHLPGTLNFFGDRYTNGDKHQQKMLRSAAKNTNFAIGYGAQLPTVASSLGLSEDEVAPKLWNYHQRFPLLCGLMNTMTRWAERDGIVKTVFGRPLHIPRDREHLHIATNHVIQGTAAEILKRSQIRVDKYLKEATGGEMRMLLPIHDELIIECPRKRLKDAREVMCRVRDIMIDFPGRFKVPLGVEVDISTVDWAHKNSYSLAG